MSVIANESNPYADLSPACEEDVALAQKYACQGPRYTSYPTAPQFRQDFPVEDYKQSLTLEDEGTRAFNMLRIGRVGLYFQSDDTRITGRWDNKDRAWVIDNSARNEVRKGLRVARQLVAPELIKVPVSAAEGS